MGERPSHDLDRLTVAEAAAALNVSQDAIRKRIARGTIAYDRDESGRGHVYVSPSETVHKTDQDTASKTDQDVYIRSLEDQIRFLREELERTHVVLRNLTERIPELEAPQESPETVEQTSEGQGPTRVRKSHRSAYKSPRGGGGGSSGDETARGLFPIILGKYIGSMSQPLATIPRHACANPACWSADKRHSPTPIP